MLETPSLCFLQQSISTWGVDGTAQCIFCLSMELPKKPLSNRAEMVFKGACEVQLHLPVLHW